MQKLNDRDLLTALVLFFIGAVSLSQAGSDVRNWIFPLLATYLILAIATVLTARVAVAAIREHAADAIHWGPEDRIVLIDLLVFGAIVLAYLSVMYGLGFWVASFLMLSLTSMYVTVDKTPRNLGLAVVVPFAACVMAYFVFLHVFYVPLPQASWWSGLR